MAEQDDGAEAPGTPLSGIDVKEKINALAQARLSAMTKPDGSVTLNVVEMSLDLEIMQLKLEALFEELGEECCVDPAKVLHRLVTKIDTQIQMLRKPTIALARGKVPRTS